MKQIHAENDRLVNDKMAGKSQFGVVHFAGPVTYDADHFVERNTDSLPSLLASTMSKARNKIIRAAFQEISNESIARRGSPKKTILEKCRIELKDLISSIDKTQSRYIRCIKANEPRTVGMIDHLTVMRQLKCAGLVAAIDLSRESFPSKLPFALAEERFRCLLDQSSQEMLKELPQHDRVQCMMSMFFAPLLEVYRNCDFTLPFACGKTRVYFRAGALELLESKRHEFYSARAVILQRWLRCTQCKRRYARFCRGLSLAQSRARLSMQRSSFRRIIARICLIQSTQRSHLARQEYLKTKRVIVKVQAAVKAKQGRSLFLKCQNAAVLLCATYRMSVQLQQYKICKLAIWKIQTGLRNSLRRREHRDRKLAAWKIQTSTRDYIHRQRLKRGTAALTIQSTWIAHRNLKRFERRSTVLKIQSAWRIYWSKKMRAALNIQSVWRAHFNRKQRRMLAATLTIQSTWRMHHNQIHLASMKPAGFTVQSAWRKYARKQKWFAALKIQAAWRTYRELLHLKQTAILKMQETWRANREVQQRRQLAVFHIQTGWRANRNLNRYKNLAVMSIQLAWREHLFRKTAAMKQRKLSLPTEEAGDQDGQRQVESLDTQSLISSVDLNSSQKRKDSLLSSFHQEIGARDIEIHQLRNDVAAVVEEAETQKQELEVEYEERLSAYEDEVLHLHSMIDQHEREKVAWAEKEKTMQKNHEQSTERSRLVLEKTQASHKEYLKYITEVLDKATEARRIETQNILDEMNRIKKEKNSKIVSLTREVETLKKTIHEQRKKIGALRLQEERALPKKLRLDAPTLMDLSVQRQRLDALLSPQNILGAVEMVNHRSQGSKERHIDSSITMPAEKIIEILFDIISNREPVSGPTPPSIR